MPPPKLLPTRCALAMPSASMNPTVWSAQVSRPYVMLSGRSESGDRDGAHAHAGGTEHGRCHAGEAGFAFLPVERHALGAHPVELRAEPLDRTPSPTVVVPPGGHPVKTVQSQPTLPAIYASGVP